MGMFEGIKEKFSGLSERREEAYLSAAEAWALLEEAHGNVERTGGDKMDPEMGHEFTETAYKAIEGLKSYRKEIEDDSSKAEEAREVGETIMELEKAIEEVKTEIE